MTERPRLASNLVPFSFLCDRFVPGGYTRGLGFEQRLDAVAAVEGIDGAVMGWPCPVDDPTVLKKMLADRGLALSALEPDIYSDARFKHGSLSSRDPGIRRESIERIKATIDAAAEAGAHDINLWLAQDGFDYVFEAHYADAWKWLTDSLADVAEHNPAVPISLEYKVKEPRAHQYVANAGKALLLVAQVNRPHVGITLDVGHSLYALESPAECAVLAMHHSRLQQVHLNDNYRDWDHDLAPGSANPWDLIELLFWTRRLGYAGWFNVDIFNYRADGRACLEFTVRAFRKATQVADRLLAEGAEDRIRSQGHLAILAELWDGL